MNFDSYSFRVCDSSASAFEVSVDRSLLFCLFVFVLSAFVRRWRTYILWFLFVVYLSAVCVYLLTALSLLFCFSFPFIVFFSVTLLFLPELFVYLPFLLFLFYFPEPKVSVNKFSFSS